MVDKLQHVSMGTNIKKRLFLGNLPDGISEKDIRSKFGKFGQVNSVDIKVKKVSDDRESNTFAFVELSVPSDSQLQQCVSRLNGSDINGNLVRVQVAKESFLSRLQAEREENKQGGKIQNQTALCEQRITSDLHNDRKSQHKFDNHKNADSWKTRQTAQKTATTDYNPLQMLKDYQHKNASHQEESILKSHKKDATDQEENFKSFPGKKNRNKKPSQFSSHNDEDETEEFKGGLPKFGGTKSLNSSKEKDETSKVSSGKGSLMSELENYSGMWNDQDVAPVVVDYNRKRRFDTTEDEGVDGTAFQEKPYEQERFKAAPQKSCIEKKAKPDPAPDAAAKQNTVTNEEQKKKELDNQKRIMSLQQRNDALKAQQNLIKSALKLTSEAPNKKKIFFDDEPIESTREESVKKRREKPAKKSEKKPKLFDDNDDDDNIENYADDFKSRPQFDTEHGQELLELQSRFGRDARFKLDHRFTDRGEEHEPEEKDAEHDEKDRQMAILGSILPLDPAKTQANDSSKNRIKSKAFVRFDPNAKEHEKFEKVPVPVVKDGQAKKKGKFEPTESAPLPEVSSERFYQTAGPINIGQSEGFSLRSMFQRSHDVEEEPDQDEPEEKRPEKTEVKELKKTAAPAAQPEQQNYWKNAGMWHEQLFFQDNDSRLKEALDFIRNPLKEEPYADRAKWAEYRDKLKYFYRNKMRRHTVWAEGPSRQQKKTTSNTQPEQVDETAFQFYGQPDAAKKKKKPHRTYYK